MKPGMNGLWWAAAIFLCLMNLSLAVLALQGGYTCRREAVFRSC